MMTRWWYTLRARPVRAIFLGMVTAMLVGGATVVAATQSQLPPDKQEVVDRTARGRATAIARATELARTPGAREKYIPGPEMRLTEQARPAPTPRTGLLGKFGNNCNLMGGAILIETLWQDYVTGRWHRVCAGGRIVRRGEGLGQGVVFVSVGRDNEKLEEKFYQTPVNVGSVAITAVSADKRYFTLRAEDGTTFVFDLVARAFISGPGVTATGTPAPGAPTPTPAGPRPTTPTPRAP